MGNGFDALNSEIVACVRCQRLREWCERVTREKRRSFADWDYWGKPVPNFGDPQGKGLIVGLAPAAHGANRTGRMFTGDRSGDWLFRAMHRAGLANQAVSESADDGLELTGCVITASCHCAPPDNKPTPTELANCRGWLEQTWGLQEWGAVLCLGGIAWGEVHKLLGVRAPKFGHGVENVILETSPPQSPSPLARRGESITSPPQSPATLAGQGEGFTSPPQSPSPLTRRGGSVVILGSYHPSQQNTFTGRLTEEMLDVVMARFAELCR